MGNLPISLEGGEKNCLIEFVRKVHLMMLAAWFYTVSQMAARRTLEWWELLSPKSTMRGHSHLAEFRPSSPTSSLLPNTALLLPITSVLFWTGTPPAATAPAFPPRHSCQAVVCQNPLAVPAICVQFVRIPLRVWYFLIFNIEMVKKNFCFFCPVLNLQQQMEKVTCCFSQRPI